MDDARKQQLTGFAYELHLLRAENQALRERRDRHATGWDHDVGERMATVCVITEHAIAEGRLHALLDLARPGLG